MSGDKLLFRYLNAINVSKKDFLKDEGCEEAIRFKKEYVPFVINQFLGGSIDTVLLANEVNVRMPPERHFLFLLNCVKPRKRFTRWVAVKKDKEIEILSKHYNISTRRAREYRQLISDKEMKELVTMYKELEE